MLNGMTRLDTGSILIADSVKGQVLRYDVASGTLSTWIADARLAPQTTPQFRPGANGVKVRGRDVLISSSAARKLFRVSLGADGRPAGDLAVLFELPGADDFALLTDGGIVVTTHGDRVLKVTADGAQTVLTSDPRVLGNTAVAVTGAGKDRRAIVLGTGGFSEGGKADAAVVSIPLPE
jgi:sugar lactone lactonase YvrE